ncbi:MAG: efflux transporter outer membrane subunit [Porticoccaceae bacterium]|nr:MAG: efflux transporter outer membrane subunit [Porticoccaceae bacterium]
MNRSAGRRLALALLAAATAGCVVGPDYHSPAADVPAQWSTAPEHSPPAPASPLPWWQAFNDPELDALVARALRANLDLQGAEARLRAVRASRGIAVAARWPAVDATWSYQRERESANAPALGTPGETDNLFQAGFDARWELDLFGGTRRAVEAATADVEVAVQERNGVALSLLAEVARNYIDLRAGQRQLALARANLAASQDMLSLTRARYQGGLAAELDVARAEAQATEIAARMPPLETACQAALHRLSVLLGQTPGTLNDELAAPQPIPVAPTGLPASLPSDLLRQRPDLRRAERQLAAATARIGVATAELYPQFSLLGTAGLASDAAGDFFSRGSRFWAIGPSLRWPIFRGGRVQATIEVRDAQQQQALLAYRQTLLIALEEAENAIVAYSRERTRQTALADSVNANQRAVDLVRGLYASGLSDFRTVLDAQRALFDAQTALAQSAAALATDRVALYKALGGGWDAVSLAPASGTRDREPPCPPTSGAGESPCSASR